MKCCESAQQQGKLLYKSDQWWYDDHDDKQLWQAHLFAQCRHCSALQWEAPEDGPSMMTPGFWWLSPEWHAHGRGSPGTLWLAAHHSLASWWTADELSPLTRPSGNRANQVSSDREMITNISVKAQAFLTQKGGSLFRPRRYLNWWSWTGWSQLFQRHKKRSQTDYEDLAIHPIPCNIQTCINNQRGVMEVP